MTRPHSYVRSDFLSTLVTLQVEFVDAGGAARVSPDWFCNFLKHNDAGWLTGMNPSNQRYAGWIYSERGVWCPLTSDVDSDVDSDVVVVVVVAVVVSVCAFWAFFGVVACWIPRLHLSSSTFICAIRKIRKIRATSRSARRDFGPAQVCFILSSRRTLRHSLLEWWGLRGTVRESRGVSQIPKSGWGLGHDFATFSKCLLWTLEHSWTISKCCGFSTGFSGCSRLTSFDPLGLASGYD